jgi:tryptophan synthase beta chain
MSRDQILMINLSGRGDKDMGILSRELHLGGAPAENVGSSESKA